MKKIIFISAAFIALSFASQAKDLTFAPASTTSQSLLDTLQMESQNEVINPLQALNNTVRAKVEASTKQKHKNKKHKLHKAGKIKYGKN